MTWAPGLAREVRNEFIEAQRRRVSGAVGPSTPDRKAAQEVERTLIELVFPDSRPASPRRRIVNQNRRSEP